MSERFNQLRELLSIQERMNRLMEDVMRQSHDTQEGLNFWSPAVDIYETDTEVVLKAELAEVKQQDIQVQVEDDKLTIKGERRLPETLKQEQFHHIERIYGPFVRNFTLSQNIDQEKIHADYRLGILTIVMPKNSHKQSKQITIKIE